jgi:hypothetical protein
LYIRRSHVHQSSVFIARHDVFAVGRHYRVGPASEGRPAIDRVSPGFRKAFGELRYSPAQSLYVRLADCGRLTVRQALRMNRLNPDAAVVPLTSLWGLLSTQLPGTAGLLVIGSACNVALARDSRDEVRLVSLRWHQSAKGWHIKLLRRDRKKLPPRSQLILPTRPAAPGWF